MGEKSGEKLGLEIEKKTLFSSAVQTLLKMEQEKVEQWENTCTYFREKEKSCLDQNFEQNVSFSGFMTQGKRERHSAFATVKLNNTIRSFLSLSLPAAAAAAAAVAAVRVDVNQ